MSLLGAIVPQPSPPRQIVAQQPPPPPPSPPPCQPCGPTYVATPKTKEKRKRLTRKKLDFEYITKEADIADAYIDQVIEQYDDVLPPLPVEEVSPQRRTPHRSPPQLVAWKTPEEIESMVPKPKKPSPPPERTYVVPEVKPHEYFVQSPVGPVGFDQSVLGESPQIEISPPPRTPGSTPPRKLLTPRRLFSPLPEVFGQTPPIDQSTESIEDVCGPCTPPVSPTANVERIFVGAGVSPAKLQPPSPPSPYSTEEAMNQALGFIRAAEGRSGIVRMPLQFERKRDFKKMSPITEVGAQSEIGRMGLPEIIQVDMETLGQGQQMGEQPYVRTAYVPPPRPPAGAIPEEEEEEVEEEEDVVDDIYGEYAIPISEEDIRQVAPTSPLTQFTQAQVSPPKVSPKLPRTPVGGPALDQTPINFEQLDNFERYTTTPLRTPYVTPKPSPMLSPCSSPGWTPCRPKSPQLPQQRHEETVLSDYSPDTSLIKSPASPVSPQRRTPQASPQRRSPSPLPVSPQHIAPQWLEAAAHAAESSVEQEEQQMDEMGLPSLVDLYAQHMPPVYSSPTERRERRIITWHDEGDYLASIRPQAAQAREDIQLDALPVPEEQVDVDVPIGPLEAFVPGSTSPEPQYDLSPTLPQYEGVALQEEDINMNALYTGEYGEVGVYQAESAPVVDEPLSSQRPISPRAPSPGKLISPEARENWDQLLDETRHAEQVESSIEYAPSPDTQAACGPCGTSSDQLPPFERIASPPRSPRITHSPSPRALPGSPRQVQPESGSLRMSPRSPPLSAPQPVVSPHSFIEPRSPRQIQPMTLPLRMSPRSPQPPAAQRAVSPHSLIEPEVRPVQPVAGPLRMSPRTPPLSAPQSAVSPGSCNEPGSPCRTQQVSAPMPTTPPMRPLHTAASPRAVTPTGTMSPVHQQAAAVRSPARFSPVVMPELSPLKMPRSSPSPERPIRMEPTAETSASSNLPEQTVVKKKMTKKKVVTVIPPRPTVPLEYEGEMIQPTEPEPEPKSGERKPSSPYANEWSWMSDTDDVEQ